MDAPAIAHNSGEKNVAHQSLFTAFALAMVLGLVNAQAQTVKVMIAGSSALWQTLALGTYNGGNGPTGGGGTAPFFHYTGSSKFNVTDSRPTTPVVDTGNIWIIWDSAATPNVWAYVSLTRRSVSVVTSPTRHVQSVCPHSRRLEV